LRSLLVLAALLYVASALAARRTGRQPQPTASDVPELATVAR
jgi:hypothetical protein